MNHDQKVSKNESMVSKIEPKFVGGLYSITLNDYCDDLMIGVDLGEQIKKQQYRVTCKVFVSMPREADDKIASYFNHNQLVGVLDRMFRMEWNTHRNISYLI